MLETGVTEFQDVIKLIVSTTPFDVSGYEQDSLLLPGTRPIRGSLAREGWMTKSITFTIVRPQDEVKLAPQEKNYPQALR